MKQEPSLFRHMQQQQANLLTLSLGLSMAILVSRVPVLAGPADWGFFFSTLVVLVHWHYGANYVLWHVGPSSDPLRALWDAGIILLLLALPIALQNPVYWFLASGGTYFLAWVKYSLALRQARYSGELREYMTRKAWVEVLGFSLSWIGAATQKLSPEGAPLYSWTTFVINILFLYFMTRQFGFYRMGWATEQWDLNQPLREGGLTRYGKRRKR